VEHLWVNGANLRVHQSGRVDAPTVVFSNSLGADLSMWEPQASEISKEFRVVQMDTRGHGGSSATEGDYTLALLADDVLAVMDRLDIRRAHFVGLSLGGMIGQVLAARSAARFESVTLCATFAEAPRQMWADRVDAVRRSGLGPMVEGTLDRWFTPAFRANHADLMETTRAMILRTSVQGYAGCAAAIRDMDLTGIPERIRIPTLVIAAAQDPSATPDAMKSLHARIPDAAYLEIEDAAHVFTLEQPAKATAAIRSFLHEVQAASV
jgi:3-oxoadipate enol-lactonase